jgi:hypothetical protein
MRENWTDAEAIMLFVLGTRKGDGLREELNTSNVVEYQRVSYIRVYCRDEGDEPNNPDDTSSTTCKVYEALKYIVEHYHARYVWRGADDSYLNLRFFFKTVMPTLPTTRLYYGRLRRKVEHVEELQLEHQPRLQEVFGIRQWGQYMSGMGYMISYDVADFIATLKIPPHLTWCEDLMVGLWLNPFQIQFMHGGELFHEQGERVVENNTEHLLVHRVTPEQWASINLLNIGT